MNLETKRLNLRKPKLSDWKDVIEGVGNLDVSKRTESIPYPYSKKNALEWLKDSIKKWGKKDYSFLIELKSEKKIKNSVAGWHKKNKLKGPWIDVCQRFQASNPIQLTY